MHEILSSEEQVDRTMKIEKILEGKSAIVTGAASGIGRATAKLFAAQGAGVLLADMREEALLQVREGIIADGDRAIAVTVNLGLIEDVDRMVQLALDT
jgi:NAD(P)-dependent dehydrogenase (short-subunit alcohol dehydrogenase family)